MKKPRKNRKRPAKTTWRQGPWPWLLLLTGLAAVLLGAGVFGMPLSGGTEATLADMARETGRGGSAAVPRLDGLPRFSQAPLPVWLSMAGLALFGPGEWGMRLLPALFSLGSVWLVFGLGLALWGRREAFFAGLAFCSCLGFLAFGRGLAPEPLAGFWVLLALFGSYRLGQDRDWGLYLFWLGSAGAVLSLGPAGLLFTLGPVVLFALAGGHWPLFLRLFRWQGPLLFLALAAPPWVWASLQYQDYARHYFSLGGILASFKGPAALGRAFWAPILAGLLGFLPWLFLLPPAWSRGRRGASLRGGRAEPWMWILAWVAVHLVALLLAGAPLARHGWWLWPPLALLLARPLATWQEEQDSGKTAIAVLWLCGGALALALALLLASGWGWPRPENLGGGLLYLPALAVAGGLAAFHLRKKSWALPWLPLGLAVLLGLGLGLVAFSWGPSREAKAIGRGLAARGPANTVVAAMLPERPSLGFYSGRPVYWLGPDTPAKRRLLAGLYRKGGRVLLCLPGKSGKDIAVWAYERHRLRLYPWPAPGRALALWGNFPPPVAWGAKGRP